VLPQEPAIVTLTTARLLLRPFRQDDVEAYAAMCADPEVMRYLGLSGVLTREDAWRQMAMLLGHWELRGFGMWAVEERDTGQFVGRVGLHDPEGWPEREVGWSRAFRAIGWAPIRRCLRVLIHNGQSGGDDSGDRLVGVRCA
jgi:RimJ/RimL family protein N-acetyltransferase